MSVTNLHLPAVGLQGPDRWPSGRAGLFAIDRTLPPAQRYQVLGQIAAGGMAEIFLARPRGQPYQRELALKRLCPALQDDPAYVEMFFDECWIASRLDHPSFVKIHDSGELDGSPYMAMDHVHGVNLQELLRRCRRSLPLQVVLPVTLAALDALEHAHNLTDRDGRPLNVVHRDVSPQNILLGFDGRVWVLDFGVAIAAQRRHRTAAGLVKGRLLYMAPEQLIGAPVDARADLFALAEVMYELALGRHPFSAMTSTELMARLWESGPTPPSEIDAAFPRALEIVLTRALRGAAAERFQTAAEMRRAIEGAARAASIPTGGNELQRFACGLFPRRVAMAAAARAAGDDELLVSCMQVGDRHPPSDVDDPPLGADRDRLPSHLDALMEVVTSITAPPADSATAITEPLPHDTLELQPPTRLATRPPVGTGKAAGSRVGAYDLIRLLGSGRSGETYVARNAGQVGLRRLLTLKLFKVSSAEHTAFMAAFRRRVRLWAKIDHPHVVQVVDLGTVESTPFLVTEFVEGWSLEAILRRLPVLGVTTPVHLACRIAADVCDAVAAAHTGCGVPSRKAIPHGDIAAGRVFLSAAGVAKVSAFGMSLVAPGASASRSGSMSMASPANGVGVSSFNADILAVGRLLRRMLHPLAEGEGRRRPGEQEQVFTLASVLREDPLQAIIARAAGPVGGHRYGAIHEMQLDLERLLMQAPEPVTSAAVRDWARGLLGDPQTAGSGD